MSARGASAGRAEKCTSGDGLSMPASAGVVRAPVLNQLGNRVIRASVANRCLRGWQRLRCIFRTDAARWPHCATVRHAPAQIGPLTNVLISDCLRQHDSVPWELWRLEGTWLAGPTATEHVGPRRDAARAPRQVEKCTAGAPIRGGADSPQAGESPDGPTDWAPAPGPPEPERPSSGERRRCDFSARRPRRRGPTCFGAVGPANHIRWSSYFHTTSTSVLSHSPGQPANAGASVPACRTDELF